MFSLGDEPTHYWDCLWGMNQHTTEIVYGGWTKTLLRLFMGDEPKHYWDCLMVYSLHDSAYNIECLNIYLEILEEENNRYSNTADIWNHVTV